MKNRLFARVLTICLLVSLFATFGGSASAESAAPVKLTIAVNGEPEITRDDRVFAELEKRTNTELEIIIIPSASFKDKLNAMAVSGDIPNIIACYDSGDRTLLTNWINQGIIIPFSDEMLAAAPEIVREYEDVPFYNEIKHEGNIYYQPIYWHNGVNSNQPLHIRKDLLDQLGMEVPETLDETYEMMKAMKEEFGVYFGLAAKNANPMVNMNFACGAYGLPYGGWIKDENGDYLYSNIQPGMLDALKFAKKLYSEDIMDPAVFTLDGDAEGLADQQYFSGKWGSFGSNGGGHIARFQDRLNEVNPDAMEYVIPAPAGPDGDRGYQPTPGFWGFSFITNTAEDPVAAAAFLNYLLSAEGQMLTQFGIEGIHYTYEGGTELANIVLNQEERAKEGEDHWDAGRYHQLAAPYVSWVPQPVQDYFAMNGKDQAYQDWYYAMWENQEMYQATNAIMLTSTPLWTSFQKLNSDLTNEYFNKIILSKNDDADELFAEYVEKWLSSGGTEAMAEMSETAKAMYD